MPKRICAALMLALAVLGEGVRGHGPLQAQADVVRLRLGPAANGALGKPRSLIAGSGPESGFPDALGDVLQRFLDLVDQIRHRSPAAARQPCRWP